MHRFHLLEIAEQPWCPRVVRDGVTDYLAHAIDVGDAYAPAVPLLARVLEQAGTRDVVDLAAGGGGVWRRLRPALEERGDPVRVRLTDRYPNTAAFARAARDSGGAVQGVQEPVDAASVPPELAGARTMFSAFHHFPPAAAAAMLRDAVARGAPVAVFEATHRSARALAVTLLAPLLVLVLTPFIRPFSWQRLVLTYLLPLIPLVVLIDGIVSCLRTYTPAELREIAESAGGVGYEWETGEVQGKGPIPVTYLVGVPRRDVM